MHVKTESSTDYPFGLDPQEVADKLRLWAMAIEMGNALPQAAETAVRYSGEEFVIEVLHVEVVMKGQVKQIEISEETGEEVGKIAARLMKHEDPEVRALAASALTQRPDRG